MIFGKLTQFGAGIILYGDYQDLRNAHDTIHSICNDNVSRTPKLEEYVLGLAYDIRHAYQGDREHIEVEGGVQRDPTVSIYPSVKIILPIFMIQLGILRNLASYKPTTRRNQAILYSLEAALELALEAAPEISKFCMEWLDFSAGIFTERYYLNYTTSVAYDYVHLHKGKSRLKQLPSVLQTLHWFSDNYKNFASEVEYLAKEKGSSAHSFEDMREWDDSIKW